MPRTPRLLALSALLLTAAPLAAQTSYPMITHTAPVAVRRGQTAEVTVSGRMNFAGAYKVLLEGEGVAAEVVQAAAGKAAKAPANVTSVKLRVDVAPGAPLGVREFRVATERGISTLGQLLVVADPVVSEKGPNDTPDKAVELPLPGVACGFIEKAEDVDCFRFRGRAGQVVTFDVFCARLQDKIHDLQKHADPLIVLLDAEGRELAASDDGTFADPLLEVTLPKDGDYVLQIRDAVYAGDPRWVYAVQATDRPYVRQIFPLAVNPGRQTDVEPVGSAARSQTRVALTAPEEAGVHAVSLRIGDQETNPAALVVTPLPLSNEAEPNDEPAKANKLAIPGGVNGRAGKARDLDHFAFRGAKGKALRFEVFARRFGTVLTSDLDAIVEVLSAEGAVVASNDDAEGKDPVLV
ncbi:MAG TPA: PPC domain-containing protein, partial [Gemmataceae bacterium]